MVLADLWSASPWPAVFPGGDDPPEPPGCRAMVLADLWSASPWPAAFPGGDCKARR
jgi:hypothetical protein